jgi:hypothetical protein
MHETKLPDETRLEKKEPVEGEEEEEEKGVPFLPSLLGPRCLRVP